MPRERVLDAALATGVLVFLLLHVAASFRYPAALWGAHHLSFLTPAERAAWAAAAAAILVPPSRAAIVSLLERAGRALSSARYGRYLIAAALLLTFLALKSENQFTGDGLRVASIVANTGESGADRAGRVTILAHKLVLGAMRAVVPGAHATWAFAAVSAACGVAAFFLLRRAAAEMFPAPTKRALLVCAGMLSGGVALFFGHVEEYPLMQVGVLAYLVAGVRRVRGAGSLLAPTVALAAACALHFSALALAPSWLLLLAPGGAPFAQGALRVSRRARLIAGAAVLLAALIAARALLPLLRSSYGGLGAIVPFFDAARDHAYTFLSAPHLAFTANEILLVFGGALLLPLFALRGRADSYVPADRAIRVFLGTATASTLLAILLIDAKYGSRDWDLMALPLYPGVLLLAHVALAARPAPGAQHVVLVAGAMFLHTAPWIAINADRSRAAEMTLSMVETDRHYLREGSKSYRVLGALFAEVGCLAQAERAFERAMEVTGEDKDAYNLGLCYARTGKTDEGIVWLRRAIQMNPFNNEAYRNLASLYQQKDAFAEAADVLQRLAVMTPSDADAHLRLGNALGRLARYADAAAALERSVQLDPSKPTAWKLLALCYERLDRGDDARAALAKARELDEASAPG